MVVKDLIEDDVEHTRGTHSDGIESSLKLPLSSIRYGRKSSYFVLEILFTRFTAKVTDLRRLLYQVSFSELRPLPWQHRILTEAVILSFLIIFFLNISYFPL